MLPVPVLPPPPVAQDTTPPRTAESHAESNHSDDEPEQVREEAGQEVEVMSAAARLLLCRSPCIRGSLSSPCMPQAPFMTT
jgi:hypothetical protein